MGRCGDTGGYLWKIPNYLTEGMIYLILLVSLGLRLIGINQSLWLDEAISANVAKMSLDKIITVFSIHDFHPPVFYVLLNVWVKIFGNGVVQMRLLPVLAGIVTIWLVYKIGILLGNKKTGLWAALLTGVNPLLVYYSQELRMYTLAMMFLVWGLYFLIKIIKNQENKKGWWIGFNLMTGLAFVTFYGSVFLSLAMILCLCWNKKLKGLGKSVWGLIIATGLVGPLLMTQLKMSGQLLTEVVNWKLVLGNVNLKNLLLIPLKFSIGRVDWYPKTYYYLIGGGWTLIVFGLAVKQWLKNKELFWLFTGPILLGILFSLKSPLMQYFRFLYLIPILALTLAKIKNKWIKIFLVLGFMGFSCFYSFNQKMYREDWKSVAANLGNGEKVYVIESFSDPVIFYNPTVLVRDIKTISPSEDRVVVIPYGETIHGLDIKEKMEKLGYKLSKENNFRELILQEWQKKK